MLIDEFGDICWFLENAAKALNVTVEDFKKANKKKMVKRYPNGYNTMDAMRKRDKDDQK